MRTDFKEQPSEKVEGRREREKERPLAEIKGERDRERELGRERTPTRLHSDSWVFDAVPKLL